MAGFHIEHLAVGEIPAKFKNLLAKLFLHPLQ
jgi:hypothetical protein